MFCVQEQQFIHCVFLYFGVGAQWRLWVSCDTCLGAEFNIWAALSPEPGEADTARAATNVAVSEGHAGFGHFIVLCVQKQQFIHCVFLYFGVGVHSGAGSCDTCLAAEFNIWAALSPDPGEADTARAATGCSRE